MWLEIGFGGAEHLVWQARHNPHAGLIGCEVFADGIVKAVAAIEEQALGNVRLYPDDARDLLRWLPEASLARVFMLFPDPWPKKRHVKRRLVTRALLDLLARAMAPAAELRVATDIGDYARTILLAARGHPAFVWQASGAAGLAAARGRLAADALRGQGARGRAPVLFFPVSQSRMPLSRHNLLARGVTIS